MVESLPQQREIRALTPAYHGPVIPVTSSFCCSAFPAVSLGFTIFAYVMAFFFNPIIEVVTFRLCGRCMLGAFLLLVLTRLGQECQDLLNPCDGMHVCTD